MSSSKARAVWTTSEDNALLKAVVLDKKRRDTSTESDEEDWDTIAESIPGKTAVQCLKRYMVLNNNTDRTSGGVGSGFEAAAAASAAAEEEESKPAAKSKKRTKVQTGEDLTEAGGNDDDAGDNESARAVKRLKTDQATTSTASMVQWSENEIRLLKKLVEQYKDCKCMAVPVETWCLNVPSKYSNCLERESDKLTIFCFLQLPPVGTKSQQTLQEERQLIVFRSTKR
jgi:Myb-like DNA-binding domain